jgi:AcrR family transcriptional regulator
MTSQPSRQGGSPRPAPRAGNAFGRKEMRKSALTRQRILDAAARMFAQKGYVRTLMGDISQAAEVHITALYYHFNTKDDLAEAVINHVALATHEDTLRRVNALAPEVTFLERFRTAIHAQLESIVERRDYVLAQTKVLSELPEERQERHRALLQETAAFWRGLLQEGLAGGAIRPGFDAGVGRMIIQGSIAWTLEWYRPDGRNVADIADQIADTMLHGIAARDR